MGGVVHYAWNCTHKNGGMYKNRALLSKNIIFEDGDMQTFADVLSCAAPNKSASQAPETEAARKHQREILESRIRFVFAVSIMHAMAKQYRPAKRIVYAVPAAGRG